MIAGRRAVGRRAGADVRCFCGSLKSVFANASLLSVDTWPNVLDEVRPDAPPPLLPAGGAVGGPLPSEGVLCQPDAIVPALPRPLDMRPLPAVCQAGADDDAEPPVGEVACGRAPGASWWPLPLVPRIWPMSWLRAALPTDAMAVLGTEKLVWVDEAGVIVVPLDGAAPPPPPEGRLCGRDSKYLRRR